MMTSNNSNNNNITNLIELPLFIYEKRAHNGWRTTLRQHLQQQQQHNQVPASLRTSPISGLFSKNKLQLKVLI